MTQRKHVPLHLKRRPSLLPLSTASLRSPSSFRKLNSAADLTVAADLRDVTSRYIARVYQFPIFLLSLSLLSSPTIREEIRIHPNARLLSLIFFFPLRNRSSIIDSPISVANGLLFSKNSSGITRALPLGAHLAVSLVYTRTHTHARRRRTCSPRGNATPISLQRSNCCARGKNSEDEKEERTRKRVSRPRESNKFDTHTLSLSSSLSLSLLVCALVGFQACSRAARLYRRVICPDSANNRSIIL